MGIRVWVKTEDYWPVRWRLLEQMKNELVNSRVIFITAYDKIEYAAKAIRLSAFDFLMKPVKTKT